MVRDYKGIIVEESLEDNRIVNEFDIQRVEISNSENSTDRWHMYTVMVSRVDIDRLAKSIKQGWYMHFWKGREVIVIFRDKQFEFNFDDKATWQPVLEYGRSLAIPEEQLDFPID